MKDGLRRIVRLVFTLPFFLLACENDIERVNLITGGDDLATLKGSNIKVIYSDSAKVQVQIMAPEYESFPQSERPYMEFPQGMEVYFYDDSLVIESQIICNYAIYYTEENLWHAKGDVEGQNLRDGTTLNTEELFWNEQEKRIYNEVYTRVRKGKA
jgi:hypothetical protein